MSSVGACGLALALAGAVMAASDAAAPRPRLDHVPIAVADLAAARTTFERLGFRVKPGRLHDNGLENVHIKLRDGAALELVTAHRAGDALAREYLDFLERGDGPAFLALAGGPVDALVGRLRAAEAEPAITRGRAFDWLTLEGPGAVGFLFFIDYRRAPVDLPEHLDHPNGAVGLGSVWLAGDGGDAAARLLAELGLAAEPAKSPLDGSEARAVELGRGRVHLLPLTPAARPIVGVTVVVESFERVLSSVAAAGLRAEERANERGRSLLFDPSVAHGVYLELLEPRRGGAR